MGNAALWVMADEPMWVMIDEAFWVMTHPELGGIPFIIFKYNFSVFTMP